MSDFQTKYSIWIKAIASGALCIFLISDVAPGVSPAPISLNRSTLAPPTIVTDIQRSNEIYAAEICRIIERRAQDWRVKTLDQIYTDDILLWKKSTEPLFKGCEFELSPTGIWIYLPGTNLSIRYYNSSTQRTLAPGTDWSTTKTDVVTARINRQIIRTTRPLFFRPNAPLARFARSAITQPAHHKKASPPVPYQAFTPGRTDTVNILLIWPPVKYYPARISSLHYLASALTDTGFLAAFAKKLSETYPEDPFYRELAKCPPESLPRFNVEVLDLSLADDTFDLAAFVKEKDYQVIGFSSLTHAFKQTTEEIEAVKAASPASAIITGGWHVSALPEDALADTACDAVVKGQGVETFAETALRLYFSDPAISPKDQLRKIAPLIEGIYYRSADGKPVSTGERSNLLGFDSYPFPHRSYGLSVFKKDYPQNYQADPQDPAKKIKGASLFTSFGCPFRCEYCANPAVYKKYLARDLARVREEIEELYGDGARILSFRDETLTLNRERTMMLIEMMREFKERANREGSNFYWSCTTRADRLDKEMLEKMKESGVSVIYCGIESGDTELMQTVKRSNIDMKTVLENLQEAKRLKIAVFSYMQVGLPGQTWGSLIKSGRFMMDAGAFASSIFPTVPYPGSSYFSPENDGPVKVLSGMTDSKSDLRTETDDLTSEEIDLAKTCLGDLGKAQSMKAQMAAKGMEGQFICGDEFVYMSTMRTAAIVDLVIRSHPRLSGETRKEILADLLKNGTNLYKYYEIFLKYRDKSPYLKENPFAFLDTGEFDFGKDLDGFLSNVSFANGYELLKELDIDYMYGLLKICHVLWSQNKNISRFRFEKVTIEDLKTLIEALMEDDKEKNRLGFLLDGDVLTIVPKELGKQKARKPLSALGEAYAADVRQNTGLIATLLDESKDAVLLRIPVEIIETAGAENVRDLLNEIQRSRNGYVELYYLSGARALNEAERDGLHANIGIELKALPEGFEKKKLNTISLFALLKDEVGKDEQGALHDIDKLLKQRLGYISPDKTQVVAVGLQHDAAGLIRSIVLGLRLVHISRQKSALGTVDEEFVKETAERYKALCLAHGSAEANLSASDVVDAATGDYNDLLRALYRFIKLLPIIPINTEELKQIYEHVKEIITAA